MLRRLSILLVSAATVLAGTAIQAGPDQANGHEKPKMFGKGNPFTTDELPPGRTRSKLESLPEPARKRAMRWLHKFDFPENDVDTLVIDNQGGVLYVDPAPPESALEEEQTTEPGDDLMPPAASAADDAFLLHSRLGAPNVVYLDFDGHDLNGTVWGGGIAKAFDLDGNPSTFNESERNAIAEIWHRMAEDFAGFDIDVTTEEPASFGPTTGRVLVTSKTNAAGGAMPYDTGGGVAYIGVWGGSNYASYYSPALVYYDNLARAPYYIAEACAHEFGHNLGLSHDGTSSVTYYAGHGSGGTSWAPIMGNSYYNNVTQWSKGEYPDANNTQDDMGIITSKLDLAYDDHGDAFGSASPLVISSAGDVLVSNPETDPHNMSSENKGIIELPGDQDVFYFGAAAGQVDLSVVPAWDAFYRTSKRGANLDIQARLQDAGGTVLATSDPTTETDASISVSVPEGIYYLTVTSVGNGNYSDYASAGQYFVSGTVAPAGDLQVPPAANFSVSCADLGCDFFDSSNDSDGTLVSWNWAFGDDTGSTAQSPSHAYAAAGTYAVTLTVTDNDGLSSSATRQVTATLPNSPPTADFDFSCTGLTCSFSDSSSDSDGSIAAWAWAFGDNSTSSTQNPSHTYAGSGTYSVALTVTDNDDSSATTTQTVTVEALQDDESPVVNIISPKPDDPPFSGNLTLSASATDNVGVVGISIYADSKLRCSGTTSASCKWNLRKVADGAYPVTVEATDAAGNMGTATVTVTVGSGGTDDGTTDEPSNKGKGRKK